MAEEKEVKRPEPAKLAEPTGETQATHARSLQPGAKVDGAVTTNQPRGLNEPPSDSVAPDLGVEKLTETVKAENEKGYRGSVPDPTPNENYTVAGVTQGKPTPETAVVTPRS